MRKSLIHTSLERGGRAAKTKARLSRFNGLHCETVETVFIFQSAMLVTLLKQGVNESAANFKLTYYQRLTVRRPKSTES